MNAARDHIRILTFKQGLLSRLAHDLQIECIGFEIGLHDGKLRARFDLAALRVQGAVVRGQVDPGALTAADRAKIERTMQDDVLQISRFPEARFEGEVSASEHAATISGALTLHGRTRELPRFVVQLRDGRCVASVSFAPSDWGIAPYRALGGALKLQDRVTVRVDLARGEPGHTWSR